MRTAFVADPLSALDPSTDTTVGLMLAVQERGDQVWLTEARLLEAVNGRAGAVARRVEVAPPQRRHDHRWEVLLLVGSAWAYLISAVVAILQTAEPRLAVRRGPARRDHYGCPDHHTADRARGTPRSLHDRRRCRVHRSCGHP